MNDSGRITQDQKASTDTLETIPLAIQPKYSDVPKSCPPAPSTPGWTTKNWTKHKLKAEPTNPRPAKCWKTTQTSIRREIPITDLPDAPRETLVHSPELADMSSPGEVDIEDLDEDAAYDALPPDARLDRITDNDE